jgi:hypothetical protein
LSNPDKDFCNHDDDFEEFSANFIMIDADSDQILTFVQLIMSFKL